jgi:hypothetical protein
MRTLSGSGHRQAIYLRKEMHVIVTGKRVYDEIAMLRALNGGQAWRKMAEGKHSAYLFAANWSIDTSCPR